MHHLVFEMLSIFQPEELKEFRRFLASPYFNKSKRLIEIYDAIQPFRKKMEQLSVEPSPQVSSKGKTGEDAPWYENSKLTHEYLHSKLKSNPSNGAIETRTLPTRFFRDGIIKGNGKSKAAIINVYLSRLEHLAERFLKQKAYDLDKQWEFVFLLDELVRRNAKKLYGRMIKRMEREVPSYKESDADYFLRMYFLERLKYNYAEASGSMKSRNKIESKLNALERGNRFLICHALAEIAKSCNSVFSFFDSFNLQPKSSFIFPMLRRGRFQKMMKQLIDNNVFAKHTFLFEMYLALTIMLANPKRIENYYKLKSLVFKYSELMNSDDRHSLYGYLIDYCVGMRDKKLWSELVELYTVYIQNGYYKYSIHKYIELVIWRNMVMLGVRMKNTTWLEEIIRTYSNAVHPQNRRNLRNFGEAYIHFCKKEFGKSLRFLSKFKIDNLIFKLDVHNLNLMNHYELAHTDSVISEIDAYSKALKKSNIGPEVRKKHEGFLGFFKLILRQRLRKKTDLNALLGRINSSPKVEMQWWLLEKVYELKKLAKAG